QALQEQDVTEVIMIEIEHDGGNRHRSTKDEWIRQESATNAAGSTRVAPHPQESLRHLFPTDGAPARPGPSSILPLERYPHTLITHRIRWYARTAFGLLFGLCPFARSPAAHFGTLTAFAFVGRRRCRPGWCKHTTKARRTRDRRPYQRERRARPIGRRPYQCERIERPHV